MTEAFKKRKTILKKMIRQELLKKLLKISYWEEGSGKKQLKKSYIRDTRTNRLERSF